MNQTIDQWKEIAVQARREVSALRAQVASLEAQLRGDVPSALSHLQSHAARQRQALDRLNRKVLTQRFRLRLLADLGRDVTREEYLAARGENARIDDYETLAEQVPVS